jgi:8-oxo-dGTP pyrophosphatase MutT (NUDIX family)
MEQYCNNCGNFGHIYRECRHPILSYGIISYHVDVENVPRIVMIERKDSLSFIEFIRGKYKNATNITYIELLISRMTEDEKIKLLRNSFDELWSNLWIHIDDVNQRIKKEFQRSKEIFEKLKKGVMKDNKFHSLETIIQSSPKKYTMNEWEIPKGRRSGHENNRDCAIREFNEETNITPDKYKMITNMIPLIEEYRGINNIRYKHIYYVGKIEERMELNIDLKNKEQYTEIKDISWLTERECYEKIRGYDENKKKVIHSFFELYDNIYDKKKLHLKN